MTILTKKQLLDILENKPDDFPIFISKKYILILS